ncbi:MAG: hypothetical protein JXN65_03105 [Clostridia bacterium]|nr:hypothetical protein [Clostridia bacterium]
MKKTLLILMIIGVLIAMASCGNPAQELEDELSQLKAKLDETEDIKVELEGEKEQLITGISRLECDAESADRNLGFSEYTMKINASDFIEKYKILCADYTQIKSLYTAPQLKENFDFTTETIGTTTKYSLIVFADESKSDNIEMVIKANGDAIYEAIINYRNISSEASYEENLSQLTTAATMMMYALYMACYDMDVVTEQIEYADYVMKNSGVFYDGNMWLYTSGDENYQKIVCLAVGPQEEQGE